MLPKASGASWKGSGAEPILPAAVTAPPETAAGPGGRARSALGGRPSLRIIICLLSASSSDNDFGFRTAPCTAQACRSCRPRHVSGV